MRYVKLGFYQLLALFAVSGGYFYLEWVPSKFAVQCKSAEEFLEKIPRAQKKTLDRFFRHLIVNDGLGYLLLGDKPYLIDLGPVKYSFTEIESSFYFLSPYMMSYAKGWYLWETYQRALSIDNIRFLIESNGAGESSLSVVNQSLLKEHLDRHSTRFKELNGDDVTANNFQGATAGNNEILGTLLGYGHQNASLYAKSIKGLLGEDKDNFKGVWELFPDVQENERQAQHTFLERQFNFCLMDMKAISLPSFIANSFSEETLALRNQYLQSKRKQQILLKNAQFLQTVLNIMLKVPSPDTSLTRGDANQVANK